MPESSTEQRALHYSGGKLGIDQIPAEALAGLGLIYSYGEGKYARDNWKAGTDWSEFYGSAMRHLNAWWLGETHDPESGLHHLMHLAWNAITLFYYQEYQLGNDNRPAEFMTYVRDALEDIKERVAAYHLAKASEPVKVRLERPSVLEDNAPVELPEQCCGGFPTCVGGGPC